MSKFKNKIFLNYLRVRNKLRKRMGKNSILLSSRNILENNFKSSADFSFVQVGANDGVSFDFLFDFVSKRKSIGVVLEPITSYFIELKKNYAFNKNIIPINVAIHPTLKEANIYKINPMFQNEYPSWVKGIASLDPNHHKKTNINTEHMIVEKVKADSLINVLNNNDLNFNNLDYFQIDTEGFDFEVLKMIDFNIIKPVVLKFESVNLSNNDKHVAFLLLKRQGYYVFDEGGDSIAVNLNLIKLY